MLNRKWWAGDHVFSNKLHFRCAFMDVVSFNICLLKNLAYFLGWMYCWDESLMFRLALQICKDKPGDKKTKPHSRRTADALCPIDRDEINWLLLKCLCRKFKHIMCCKKGKNWVQLFSSKQALQFKKYWTYM